MNFQNSKCDGPHAVHTAVAAILEAGYTRAIVMNIYAEIWLATRLKL